MNLFIMFLKIKIKSHDDNATGFHKEIPEAGSDCTCLAVFTIDSALKKRRRLPFASVS